MVHEKICLYLLRTISYRCWWPLCEKNIFMLIWFIGYFVMLFSPTMPTSILWDLPIIPRSCKILTAHLNHVLLCENGFKNQTMKSGGYFSVQFEALETEIWPNSRCKNWTFPRFWGFEMQIFQKFVISGEYIGSWRTGKFWNGGLREQSGGHEKGVLRAARTRISF